MEEQHKTMTEVMEQRIAELEAMIASLQEELKIIQEFYERLDDL